jgi:hypothetical protein
LNLYFIIQESGNADPVFQWGQIRRCPVQLIYAAVTRAIKKYQRDHNVAAIATARVGSMFAEGAKVEQFLPFPDVLADEKPARVSESTAKIFAKLMKKGQIPDRVLMSCSPIIDEVLRLSGQS